jgi:polyphosphate kinase 2 (PPK2 family)
VGTVLPERIHRGAITLLDHVALEKSLSADRYEKELESWQARLCRLAWKAQKKGRSTVMVFEGWDAAGKGSAIRRVTAALDARLYRVVPVMAPSDEEKAHHYLWRFWRQLPREGRITIFDRSWYGRVLVERVEGFATGGEWMRSYREINDFEQQLAEHGTVVLKFWLHIDRDEQLKRFRKREKVAYKRHKITDEDWRNRERWEAYKEAVNDMVSRTSTGRAPWTIIPGNDKKFARVEVLKTVCGRLKEAL